MLNKIILLAAALMCAVGIANAQETITAGGANISFPVCGKDTNGNQMFYTGVVISGVEQCGSAPIGGGTVTPLTISGAGCILATPVGTPITGYTISSQEKEITWTAVPAGGFTPADTCTKKIFAFASDTVVPLPTLPNTSYPMGWGFEFYVAGPGAVKFSGAPVLGLPTWITPGKSGNISVDDTLKEFTPSGVDQ